MILKVSRLIMDYLHTSFITTLIDLHNFTDTPPPSRKSGSRASSRRTEDGRASRISQSALHSKLQDVDTTSAPPSRISTRPPTRADSKMTKTVTIVDEPEVKES